MNHDNAQVLQDHLSGTWLFCHNCQQKYLYSSIVSVWPQLPLLSIIYCPLPTVYYLLFIRCLRSRTLSTAHSIFGNHGQHLEKRCEKAARSRPTRCYSQINSNSPCSDYRHHYPASETRYRHHGTTLVRSRDCNSQTDRRTQPPASARMAKGRWHPVPEGDIRNSEGYKIKSVGQRCQKEFQHRHSQRDLHTRSSAPRNQLDRV